MNNPSRLSSKALSVFLDADEGNAIIIIPPIVIVEMVYLSEKGRIPVAMVSSLLTEIDQPSTSYPLGVLDKPVLEAVEQISRERIPEMPDRIIAATAKALSIPLITRDSAITNSRAVTVLR